jgi:hypothetical protein
MKKNLRITTLVALVMIPVAFALSGCVKAENEQRLRDIEVVVVDYEGHPLSCVAWKTVYNDEYGASCDFVKYHQEIANR